MNTKTTLPTLFAAILAVSASAPAALITWEGVNDTWDSGNWTVGVTPNQLPSVDDTQGRTTTDQYEMSAGTLTRNFNLFLGAGGSWNQSGGTFDLGTSTLRFNNGSAASSFTNGSVLNTGELRFDNAEVDIDGLVHTGTFLNVQNVNADIDVTSADITLTVNNMIRGTLAGGSQLDLIGDPGDFRLEALHNDNPNGNTTLAGKVTLGWFSIDGVDVNPNDNGNYGTAFDWTSQANIDLLNADLKDNHTVNGKHLFVELTGGGVNGEGQLLTLIPEPSSCWLIGLGLVGLATRRRA